MSYSIVYNFLFFFSCKRFKRFDGLSKFNKVDILKQRLDLPSKNKQDLLTQSLIDIHDVKKRRPRKDNPRKVEKTYTYFIMLGNKRTQPYLAKAGKSPWAQKRWKSESANKFGIDKLESFPTKFSHYAGKAREYLDARLCTKALFECWLTNIQVFVVQHSLRLF